MAFFDDLGGGVSSFFDNNGTGPSGEPEGSIYSYSAGETLAFNINNGAQKIEGKRDGKKGEINYTQKNILPSKLADKLKIKNADLSLKLKNSGDTKVALKNVKFGDNNLKVQLDTSKSRFTVDFRNNQLFKKNLGINASFNRTTDDIPGKDGKFKNLKSDNFQVGAAYTKGDYVFGGDLEFRSQEDNGKELSKDTKETGFLGYSVGLGWNRSDWRSKYSVSLGGKCWNMPEDLAVTAEKQVSDDFTLYMATEQKVFTDKGTPTMRFGAAADLGDGASLKAAVEAPGGKVPIYKLRYQQPLGSHVTGTLTFNTDKTGTDGFFQDSRIGWRLDFA